MVTLKDIAKAAGVAQPTVSAVLRNRPDCYISKVKRDLIFETTRKMGYVPNQLARTLRGHPSKTIGIISSLFEVDIHDDLLGCINREVWKRGYQVMLADSKQDPALEKELLLKFLSYRVDGLLIYNCNDRAELEKNIEGRVPSVFLGSFGESYDFAIDRHYGGYMAAKHLVEHNHSIIVFLTESLKGNMKKFEGYRDCLRDSGLKYQKWMCVETKIEKHGENFKSVSSLIKRRGITAFVVSSDKLAAFLIKNLPAYGIKIPDDVAVIGFDGVPYGELLSPSLTTIRQPVADLAGKSVSYLMDLIDGKKIQKEKVLIKPELIIRESCGCNKSRYECPES